MIQVAPWFGDDVVMLAGAEARRAIVGERGPIDDNTFPLDVPKDAEA